MLLFIIFFFTMVIVVGSAAVFAFSALLKRRRQLPGSHQSQLDAPPPYRSLFEPTDEELREIETQNRLAAQARKINDWQTAQAVQMNHLRESEQIWRTQTNRQNTVELLRLAAQTDSAEIFSRTAENVIEVCRREQVLTAQELADLLDSHLQILPQQERTAGASFWLKEEIKRLRGGSE